MAGVGRTNKEDEGQESDDLYGLGHEQMNAVKFLGRQDVHTGQSKWATFRQLPRESKWAYFAQYFLPPLIAVIVLLAIVISLVVTRLTRPPDPVMAVQGFNFDSCQSQFDSLKHGFAKYSGISDDRLLDMDATLTVKDSGNDDSMKALTRVTAGEINLVVSPRSSFPLLNKRGYVSEMNRSLKADNIRRLAAEGILVDQHGRAVNDPAKARGLDLSRSSVWRSVPGLPDDAILGLSNVGDSGRYVESFINYLDFD